MKARIWEDGQSGDINMFLYAMQGNTQVIYHPTENETHEYSAQESIPDRFIIRLAKHWDSQELFSDILEFLEERGVRPEDDAIRKGELTATKKHLEDMRDIAFTFIPPKVIISDAPTPEGKILHRKQSN